jgi:predicted dehydrogenase
MTAIAIIGQGNMARTHARAWFELGLGEQIKYVCTPRPGQPLPFARAARFRTDLADVLHDPEIDTVSVCTPTGSHAEIAVRALNAGKSVLLEKPIALTLADALLVAEAAANSSGTLMVAQVVRFIHSYQVLREHAEVGRLGAVRSVRASRLSSPPTWAAWLSDESASGGPLVDMAIHDFDQLNLFLGTPVSVSAARGPNPGDIETTIHYAGGGAGHVVTSAEMPADYVFSSSLELEGTAGREAAQVCDDMTDAPYTRQAAYFLACATQRVAPEKCPTSSAILALNVALAARTSLHTGRTVHIP